MKSIAQPWLLALAATLVLSCSVGSGSGTAVGSLAVENCWTGCYDLKPTFFGASPYNNTLDIRIEHGSDYESFSDGIEILVDDVTTLPLHQPLAVSLPVGVTPPGIPVVAVANPAGVHASLYLQTTCATEDVSLYAMGDVGFGPGGACIGPPDAGEEDASERLLQCVPDAGSEGLASVEDDAGEDGGSASDGGGDGGPASVNSGSWIVFDSIFQGNLDESNAAARRIQGNFDFLFADPRQMDPSGLLPAPCSGHLVGTFDFYFERGQPAQPFP